MKYTKYIWAYSIFLIQIILIDFFTNELDIINNDWDFNQYIDIAKNGLFSDTLTAPFAFRYPTPLLAGLFFKFLSFDITWSFRILAYLGGFLQLVSVFHLSNYYFKKIIPAIITSVLVGFSFYNIKFLLFDVFRPEHFAYPFIVLLTYFALKRKEAYLLIISIIAVQFREFCIVPLFAYVAADFWAFKKINIPLTLKTIAVILIAVILPRKIIPFVENHSYNDFFNYPSIWKMIEYQIIRININIVFSIISLFLPAFILFSKKRWSYFKSLFSKHQNLYLIFFSLLIIGLAEVGGTDIPRFINFLFVPLFLLLAAFLNKASITEYIVSIGAVLYFNKIFLLIPIWNFVETLDFYGGYHTVVNWTTIGRTGLIIGLTIISRIIISLIKNKKFSLKID